uniref:protein-tyrosine-phosphatase n=1 Tax=Glossina pallidipes TaxID=7398 RepID=A0A1A9ZME8_GLOPL
MVIWYGTERKVNLKSGRCDISITQDKKLSYHTPPCNGLCSSIAEAVMAEIIEEAGLGYYWQVHSAAIGGWNSNYHSDEGPLSLCTDDGVLLLKRARQMRLEDFKRFDYIFGMNKEIVKDLKGMAPINCKDRVQLLGDYGLAENESIIDGPYYENDNEDLKRIYEKCTIACNVFLTEYAALMQEMYD